jgi:signal transduction histidine kinase
MCERLSGRLVSVAVLSIVAVTGVPTPAAAPSRPARTVLTIHTGAEDFPANPVLDAAIQEALGSRPDAPVTYFAEYVESEQFGEQLASRSLAGYIREKYRGRRIDVVIAVTNTSLQLILDNRDLFPDVPIVFGGLSVPDESVRTAGAGIAALQVGRSYTDTLKMALDLQPATKEVFVLARTPNDANVEAVRTALAGFTGRAKLTYIDEPTTEAMLARVRAVPPTSLILHIWHRNEGPDNEISPADTARFVAEASPVPVYGTVDANIGTGILGGVVRGTHETGRRLGSMAREILDGRRPQDIPVEAAPIVPTFDWRQMQRWGVDASRLPPGSKILFRTLTPWEAYRPYIVAGVVLMVAQLLLIAALLTQRARRRRAEETIREREATLRKSYGRIRQLTGRIITEQETARAEIARDLHDDISQRLAYVSMAVNELRDSLGRIENVEIQQAFEELEHDTQSVFDGIRRLSHELHPTSLRLLGLAATLKRHCSEVEKRHNVRVTFETDGDLTGMHPDLAICFFRVAQEALRNGLTHGAGTRFSVSLIRFGDEVELNVVDNGRGFDLEAVRREGRGLGLVSMEERAHIVGAHLTIVSAPGEGTSIRLRSPLRRIEPVAQAVDSSNHAPAMHVASSR